MISFKNSKSGDLTALYNTKYIHSSYSPPKEAKAFCEQNKLHDYSTVLFIEPGLNYCSNFLKSKNMAIKIISIHLHCEFYQRDNISDYKFLANSNGINLKSFLSNVLVEMDMEGFKFIELPFASRLFPGDTSAIKEIILQHLKEIHGNITTISGFGFRQIKNFIKNYMNNNLLAIPSKTNSTILITASGPGLEKSLGFIQANREDFLLLSLPSSVKYLSHFGIEPDLIISTDPGYYASLHLHHDNIHPLIAPYTANILNNSSHRALIPLNQHSFIENTILNSQDAFVNIPSNGTVAGSALLFALSITSGPIIICGLDFAFLDIKSHVRPHSFDTYLEKRSNRINSITNTYYTRNISNSRKVEGEQGLRINSALSAYKGWFSSFSAHCNSRCFLLNSLTEPPGSFKDLKFSEAKGLLHQKIFLHFNNYNNSDYALRKKKIKLFITSQKNIINNFLKETNNQNINKSILDFMAKSIIFNIDLPELLKIKRLSFSGSEEHFLEEVNYLLKKTLLSLDKLNNYVQ